MNDLPGLSLFSGCLGLDLGLEELGFRPVAYVENDRDCQKIIAARRPSVPIIDDVRDLDALAVFAGQLEWLAGGFPCQDLSYAGKRAGLDGERSALWFNMADAIRLLRPRLVLVENVPGLASRGLGRVLYDLAEAGYVGSAIRIRASDVGAPHGRERILILAADAERLRVDADGRVSGRVEGKSRRSAQAAVPAGPEVARATHPVADGPGPTSDTGCERLDGRREGDARSETGEEDGGTLAEGSAEAVADASGDRLGRVAALVREDGGVGVERGDDADGRDLGGDGPHDGHEGKDAADTDGSGSQGSEPEGRRLVPAGGGGEAPADACGEPGQSGVGRRTPGGADARRGSSQRDRRRLDGPAERGAPASEGSAADSVDGPGGGERARPDSREGGAAAADSAGRGRRRGSAREGRRDDTDGQTPIGVEGEQAAGDGSASSAPSSDADSGGSQVDSEQDSRGSRLEARESPFGDDADGRSGRDAVSWGVYGAAVRHWEDVLGRTAPEPTDDRGRLNPRFVEWMLGFPHGWVDIDGVSRTAQLRALGNSVQVQVGTVAGAFLLTLTNDAPRDTVRQSPKEQ